MQDSPGLDKMASLEMYYSTACQPIGVFAVGISLNITGPLSSRAGHDINYLAISGILSVS